MACRDLTGTRRVHIAGDPSVFTGSSRLGWGASLKRAAWQPVWVPPFHGKGHSSPLHRGWLLRSKEAREAKSLHALGQAGQRADLLRLARTS